ncbi:LysR family transcriptional regulator [Alginatibacterium sediminis]|uniref:LysR family transcriptional regulator n=1 Tax=Alginatibacterium sediminis TaxID=2164068 RepID=A0A420EH07_9ALTE|nr:LysR family transcriptional regulator [Alginatibacterium sediminis]RKF19995.1 LysR family transcriptional regulator [Alginatibacterium sediminis]
MSKTKQLQLFADVVQQGSFTKAAALHGLDNSALSKQIKNLEKSLGVQLLNRSTRSFSLTEPGQSILQETKKMLYSLEQIHHIAENYQAQPQGMLRITCPHFFGQHIQAVISDFMKTYPGAGVTLSLTDIKEDIIADRFDIAFRLGKLQDSNLIAKKIAPTQFALIASEKFIKQNGMPNSPKHLVELPAIIYNNSDVILDQFKMSESAGSNVIKSYRMQGRYRVGDVRAMIAAVVDGLGYSLIDLSNLESSIDQLGLVALLTDHTLSTMDTGIYALYPHRIQTPLVSVFLKLLVAHIGAPPYWQSYVPDYQNMYQ